MLSSSLIAGHDHDLNGTFNFVTPFLDGVLGSSTSSSGNSRGVGRKHDKDWCSTIGNLARKGKPSKNEIQIFIKHGNEKLKTPLIHLLCFYDFMVPICVTPRPVLIPLFIMPHSLSLQVTQ